MASHNFKAQSEEEKNTNVIITFSVEKIITVCHLFLIWDLSKQKIYCVKYTNQDLPKYFPMAIS